MPYTATYQTTQSIYGATSFSVPTSYNLSGNGRVQINESVPSGTTNSGVNFTFTVVSGAYLGLTSNGVCTVSTNSTGSPANRFILSGNNNYSMVFARTGGTAGAAVFAGTDSTGSALANVTALYVTNNDGGSNNTLTVETLYDASPNWGSSN